MVRRLVLVTLVALAGCGPLISVERLNSPTRPMTPRPPDDVELLTQKPSRPFVEVAMIRIEDSVYDATPGTLFEKIRVRGGKMGCDAIVIVGRDDGTELFDRSRKIPGYMASCLQYNEAAPRTEELGPAARLRLADRLAPSRVD